MLTGKANVVAAGGFYLQGAMIQQTPQYPYAAINFSRFRHFYSRALP
jgi:hypothetical protein